jgi:diaminopimelate decarboxylase
LFVLSADQIRRNVQRFQTAFQAGWSHGPVHVMPAAKANWVYAVQRLLAQLGCGCDVYSSGELTVALAAGFPPERISVNGMPKDAAHIQRAITAGARLTIDSLEDVAILEQLAQRDPHPAQVRLRLKPVLSDFTTHSDFVSEGLVPTDIAALVYKGGLAFAEILAAIPRLRRLPHITIVGFHQHHGRHHRSVRYWEAQMRAYAHEIGRVCQVLGGYQPQEIDIGGGFAIPRDPHNAATDYSEPLQLAALYSLSQALRPLGPRRRYAALARLIDTIVAAPNNEPAPSIEAYAAACTHTLSAELRRQGLNLDGVALQLEPGRAIHGDAGIHLATVRAIKRLTDPIRWQHIALDTTEFWFTGGRYEHHLHDFRIANKCDAPATTRADIIGRSCYGDRLLPTVRTPALEVGDVVAFLDTGAYQEVSNSNFNALPRPATVLVSGAQAWVIRQRETEEDVFRRDVRLEVWPEPGNGASAAAPPSPNGPSWRRCLRSSIQRVRISC